MKMTAAHARIFLILAAVMLASATVFPLAAQEQSVEAQKHYTSAKALLKKGERDKAIAELKEAIRLAPEFIEAHQDYITHQTIAVADLVKEYEKSSKERSGSAVFHYLLGRAYAKASRNQEAKAAYEKSLELSPGFSWALLELGAEALKEDNRVQAVEYFERARLKAGENPLLRFQLASRLQLVRSYESALAEAQQVLQLDPAYFEAYPVLWRAKLGLAAASEEAQAEVMRNIEALEKKNPEDPKTLDAIMRGYRIFFDDEAAAAIRKRILELDPRYFASQGGEARFAIVTTEGKRLEFSGPELDRALEAAKLADPRERIEVYRQIAEGTKDENLKLHVLYPREFDAHLKAGDLESAERLAVLMEEVVYYRMGLSAILRLAEAYLAKNIELDRAQAHAEKAIRAFRKEISRLESDKNQERELASLKRTLASALHTQARILLAQDRKEAAITSLQESMQLHEAEAVAVDLGLTYEKLNRLDEAVQALVKAVSFDGPRKQVARTALDLIYGDREKTAPLAILLEEAVAKRKKSAAESGSGARVAEKNLLDGKEAPDFELASVKGAATRLSNLRGNVVLLNFWATW